MRLIVLLAGLCFVAAGCRNLCGDCQSRGSCVPAPEAQASAPPAPQRVVVEVVQRPAEAPVVPAARPGPPSPAAPYAVGAGPGVIPMLSPQLGGSVPYMTTGPAPQPQPRNTFAFAILGPKGFGSVELNLARQAAPALLQAAVQPVSYAAWPQVAPQFAPQFPPFIAPLAYAPAMQYQPPRAAFCPPCPPCGVQPQTMPPPSGELDELARQVREMRKSLERR